MGTENFDSEKQRIIKLLEFNTEDLYPKVTYSPIIEEMNRKLRVLSR